MRRITAVLVLVLLAAGALGAQSSPDARALAVADEMMKAMGGEERWAQARFIRFDWVVEREGRTVANVRHLWDRYDGRYRVEWESRDGKKLLALFNINTRTGRVWVNGELARDEDEQGYLDQAYGRFINDCYWLLMPWKLKDLGVKLKHAGETRMDGQTYDILHLSFDSVGLTPGDHYWAYVNRRTHLMDRWAYFLQSYEGAPALEKATSWTWEKWEEFGGLRLARDKVRVGGDGPMRIHFPLLAVLPSVDDAVFDSPEVSLPGESPQ